MYLSSDYRSGEHDTSGSDAQELLLAGRDPNTSNALQSSHIWPHQTTRKAYLILPSPEAKSSTHLPQTLDQNQQDCPRVGGGRELSSSPLHAQGTEPPVSDVPDVTRRVCGNTGTWVHSSRVPV